jgi:hypothetical protein
MRPPGHIEKGVMFGRDGYLFLLDGGHHVFDLLLGMRKIAEQSRANVGENIDRRAAVCRRAGAGYLHVIYPDKHSILTDEFPVKDPFRLADDYLNKLPGILQWVFYPRQVLRDAVGPVFLQTDTHLTDRGNIVAAGAVVERLLGESQAEHVNRLLTSSEWKESERAGDLGGRFDPPLSERHNVLRKWWPIKWFHNNLTGGNDGMADVLFSPEAVYRNRVLVFGDSFSRDLSGYLSYFFKEVVFLRTRYFHDDIFQQIQPDFVITSNVERYLSHCESDDSRPSFFMYPHLSELNYAPDKAFAEAFSAVLSYGRTPYLDFIRKNDLIELNSAELLDTLSAPLFPT